jgi:hypothetical protein
MLSKNKLSNGNIPDGTSEISSPDGNAKLIGSNLHTSGIGLEEVKGSGIGDSQ